MRDLIRFFRVVPPLPSLMIGTFAIVTGVSVVAVCLDTSLAAGTLRAVLVLQLFAASSGFMTHARRGHYDLLLTRSDDRAAIAFVQWTMSAAPGIASSAVIIVAEALASAGRGTTGLTSGSILSVLVVSTTPWALTTPLPRFAAAIGWLAIFTLGAAVSRTVPIPSAVVNVIYPLGMVGHDVGFNDAWLPLGVSAASMGAALAWIRRVSIPLEAAQ